MDEWHLLDKRGVLPFRFRKITAMIGRRAIALDRFKGNKIKSYSELFETLIRLANREKQSVSRVFFSLNEFSNADRLRNKESMRQYGNRLLRSWMVIESDYELPIAIHLYRRLYQQLFDMNLADKTTILATGSRSLHFVIPFDMEKYLTPKQWKLLKESKRYNPTLLHWLQIKARKQFLHNYLNLGDLVYMVDTKVAFDILRQIPVPYTFYYRIKKFITPLHFSYVFSDPSNIFRKCAIYPIDFENHHLLDDRVRRGLEQYLATYTQGGQAIIDRA